MYISLSIATTKLRYQNLCNYLALANQPYYSGGQLALANQPYYSGGQLALANQPYYSGGQLALANQRYYSGGQLALANQPYYSGGQLHLANQPYYSRGQLALANQPYTILGVGESNSKIVFPSLLVTRSDPGSGWKHDYANSESLVVTLAVDGNTRFSLVVHV